MKKKRFLRKRSGRLGVAWSSVDIVQNVLEFDLVVGNFMSQDSVLLWKCLKAKVVLLLSTIHG